MLLFDHDGEPLITHTETAALGNVAERTLADDVAAGRGPALLKRGKFTLIRLSDALAWSLSRKRRKPFAPDRGLGQKEVRPHA